MKIRCPNCLRISEIPHVEHGRIAVCSCLTSFRIDDATVTEEFSLPDLPPPETIGKYRILRYVGRGASNCVYEGIQPETGAHVAIKTLIPDYAGDKPSREQFLHAAKIYAKAVHPNIVKVFETGKDANGVPFLAMEFLSGGTLADRMQENRTFTATEAAEIGAAVCHALIVTAELGIVHRDIKPDNIMISADGQYKLTDLGLAKLDPSSASGNEVRLLEENRTDREMRKTSFGTLEYMSPEQFIDAESCDIRSDIYSLGVTMYQLAAGRLPFAPNSRSELRHMHLSIEPLVPSTFKPDIPLDFDYIVLRCIQKNPEDRYRTPSELLQDLEAFLAGKPLPSTTGGAVPTVHAPDASAVRKSADPRSSALIPVAAVMLLLLIFCILGLKILAERHAAKENRSERSLPTQRRESVPENLGIDAPEKSPAAGTTGTATAADTISEGEMRIQEKFEAAKAAADRAVKDGYGFTNAIEQLKDIDFRASAKYNLEAQSLISELKKASEKAVDELIGELDEKARPFREAGDWENAIKVYRDGAGPLAAESEEAREQKIHDVERERMRRKDAASSKPAREEGSPEP